MQTFVQNCTAGCGRVRTINLPDGAPAPSGTYLCGVDAQPVEDQRILTEEQARIAAEIIARRLQLRNDLEALKQNQPVWWAQVMG